MSTLTPILNLSDPAQAHRLDQLISRLTLSGKDLATGAGKYGAISSQVSAIIADVASRGDAALVDIAKQYDDPGFSSDRLRVSKAELAAAHAQIDSTTLAALRHAIAQVRQYQQHILPPAVTPELVRPSGSQLSLRFTPLDRVGLYVPGGKASYPSSLIMLAVPAQVAGVKQIVVCTPPTSPDKKGSDTLLLAAAHELGLSEVFRTGGAGAIAALALGTPSITKVDKIAGPGNLYVQLAKRLVSGSVGIDGFAGPSEVLVIADESANPKYIAADLMAQAEHDPGSCFLLTTSSAISQAVLQEIEAALPALSRKSAIQAALTNESAIAVHPDMNVLLDLANRIACEHVNLQVKNPQHVLAKLRHAGAIFIGPHAPVAAGDYVAGPSHCLPTNTTARFASGISVYEFLKRTSLVTYTPSSIATDAPHAMALATAEGLSAHHHSLQVRISQ